MNKTSSILTAGLCLAVSTVVCSAQPTTSFHVVTSNNATSGNSGWVPFNIYAIDVNNDGVPDLVQDLYRSGYTAGTGQFGISIARGDGTFKPAVAYNYPPGITGDVPMAFGDFNGDGKIDIATTAGHHTVAIYLGRGDGTFQNPWYSVVPLASSQIIAAASFIAADFNRDGKLDLAVVGTDNTTNTVYILPGQGNGLFSSAKPVLTVPGVQNASGWGVQKMLLGDFDGDHNADLALVATTADSAGDVATLTLHVLYGAGNFSFENTTPSTSPGIVNINSGDLNSDGISDLFAIDAGSYRIDTFYGRTDRTFASYTQPLPATSYYGARYMPSPAMADFNDDGHMDLVTITNNPYSGLIYMMFLLSNGSPGQFTTQTWNITTSPNSAFFVPAVGDFNHDQKPDFAFVRFSGYGGDSTIYTGLNTTSNGLWTDCDYPTAARGISMCSPAGWSDGTVNFNAAAHSFGQLRKIELWVDGKKLGEQYHTWQSDAWFRSSSALGAGVHKGTYVAADVDNTLQFFNFQFSVPSNCSAPASAGVHICDPSGGSTTSANPIFVEATSRVTGTLARMEVWVDSTKRYTETNSTALSVALRVVPGTHQFTVFAVNTAGATWKQSVTATVP